MKEQYQVKSVVINGIPHRVVACPDEKLVNVIRKQLHLTGTKLGCGMGQCGACNVILDGKVTRSCVTPWKKVPENADILTIEGIGTPDNLHAIQWAFITSGAIQCGFCTPGFIMAAKGLLDKNLNPTREEVRDWFQEHWTACRCTGYKQITDAVMDAAAVL
ncbi:MAG TPA: aldehyde oxidoreductase, partial [Synergistaceae bacterium]|nr:aldehyde oxidoreductase [Synergistaceae bacterium]